MKIILSENQLDEIITFRGAHSTDPSYEMIFSQFEDKRKFTKAIEEYLNNVMGYRNKNLNIGDYAAFLTSGDPTDSYHIPSELKKIDVKSNLAYFLAKKFGKLKRLGSLDCLKLKEYEKSSTYFFFDPELEVSVGHISVSTPYGEVFENKKIKVPKGAKAVTESAVDKEVRGSGIGKEMYLSVLEDVPLLFSDGVLSQNSLNIWVNVLPRFVYTGAIYEKRMGYSFDYKSHVKQITPKSRIMNHEDVQAYFATKDENIFNKMIR